MSTTTSPRLPWLQACRHPAVWLRAARLGLVVVLMT
jgi:hypothetical protein